MEEVLEDVLASVIEEILWEVREQVFEESLPVMFLERFRVAGTKGHTQQFICYRV